MLSAHGQYNLRYTIDNNGKIIAFPAYRDFEIKIPELSQEYYTTPIANKNNFNFHLNDVDLEFLPQPADLPMNMQVLSAAYKPFFNIYAPMLLRTSPMVFDFTEISIVPIEDNINFMVVGRQQTWPGLGGLTTVNPMISWNVDDFTLTGGAYAGRYFTPFNPDAKFTGGVNLHLHYQLTDWMAARAWGVYSFYDGKEKKNPHMLLNPFYPKTSVGGAMEFKINDNVGIGVGVNYEYNPWRKRMEAQRLIYPVIRSGNIKIGAW